MVSLTLGQPKGFHSRQLFISKKSRGLGATKIVEYKTPDRSKNKAARAARRITKLHSK